MALSLATTCRHVLVATGADRVMRFWDASCAGALLCGVPTGHLQGSNVIALAVAHTNDTVVTADTGGYVMVRK